MLFHCGGVIAGYYVVLGTPSAPALEFTSGQKGTQKRTSAPRDDGTTSLANGSLKKIPLPLNIPPLY